MSTPTDDQIFEAVTRVRALKGERIGVSKLVKYVKEKHSEWLFSRKRLSRLLRTRSIENKEGYTKLIKSSFYPISLPGGVKVEKRKGRGKCMFAVAHFEPGETIFTEDAVIFSPQCQLIPQIRLGILCTSCTLPVVDPLS